MINSEAINRWCPSVLINSFFSKYERPTTSLRSPAFKLIAEGTTGKISALIEAENLLLRRLENEAVLFPSTSELKAGTVQRLILYPLK